MRLPTRESTTSCKVSRQLAVASWKCNRLQRSPYKTVATLMYVVQWLKEATWEVARGVQKPACVSVLQQSDCKDLNWREKGELLSAINGTASG